MFKVDKYTFQCTNVFFSAQICFSLHKIFHGTQWAKNGQHTKTDRLAQLLAQLVERRTTVREVSGSSPRQDQHSGS